MDSNKTSMIKKIKQKGLIFEAHALVSDLKNCAMRICDAMQDNQDGDEDGAIQALLAEILGSLIVQTVALETALSESALTPEHKPLVEFAFKTVKDVNLHFNPKKKFSSASV